MNDLVAEMAEAMKVNRPTPPNQGPIVAPGVPCKVHPGYQGFKEPADRNCKGCRWMRLQYLFFRDKLVCQFGFDKIQISYVKSRSTKNDTTGY